MSLSKAFTVLLLTSSAAYASTDVEVDHLDPLAAEAFVSIGPICKVNDTQEFVDKALLPGDSRLPQGFKLTIWSRNKNGERYIHYRFESAQHILEAKKYFTQELVTDHTKTSICLLRPKNLPLPGEGRHQ